LAGLLPGEAGLGNPVDLLGSATAATYEAALPPVLSDPNVDAVIVLFVPPVVAGAAEVAGAIRRAVDAVDHLGKPVLAVVMSDAGTPPALREGARPIACFSYPESAAAALGHAAARADWLRRPAGTVPELAGLDPGRAREIVVAALDGAGNAWPAPPEVRSLLEAYGLPLVEERYVTTEAEGLAAADELGYPLVAKTTAPGVHKTERGGVALDLRDGRELAEALARVGLLALIQPMVRGAAELLAGVVQDPVFGPLVAFGPGGGARRDHR
jgi:acetate---CoA ligase (ADP-forming)